MATGDLEGNLERMRVQLRSIAYPHPLDIQGLREGLPVAFLPLLHYAFLSYSRHVARYLSACGYELYAKSDLRFIECTLKFLRTEFNYRCSLTLAQLFTRGFVERKLHFVHDVIQMCKRKHYELLKQSRQARFMCKKNNASEHGVNTPEHVIASQDEEMSELDQLPKAKYQDRDETRCHLQGEVRWKRALKTAMLSSLVWARPMYDPTPVQGAGSPTKVTILKKDHRPKRSLEAFYAMRNSYQEMYEKLLDISDQMAQRFCCLEQNLTRIATDLQERFVNLEDRILRLEHHPPCEVVTAAPNVVVNYNKAFDEHPSESSILEHTKTAAGMKDMSNTRQRNSRNDCWHNSERTNLTQEFIAKVKARFNHAKQLLDAN